MSERNTQEEEYFARQDAEKLQKLRSALDEEDSHKAEEALKELHHHKCGKCGHEMETKAFRGVEIEICPNCGAVLLDRGELQELAGDDASGFVGNLLSIFSKGE